MKIRDRVISLILCVMLAVPLVSCEAASSVASPSSWLLSGGYRMPDGEDVQASASDDDSGVGVLTLGEKDSGSFLEEYEIVFEAPEGKDVQIAYRSHIQDAGWCQWSPSGSEISYAQYYGIDTVQIFLYGADAFMYDVSYRVAVAGEDWQEWAGNGEMAGVPEQHRPIEAVEIRVDLRDDESAVSESSASSGSPWTLTEFGDDDGRQAMFYTMRNNIDGTLIVVDGGWEANEAQVRSVINLFGGHVDHWFLTHYDEDHASAFNAIYADPCGITIGEVYATPLDYDYYLECAEDRWWDVPFVYETFLEQTEGDERVHYLSRGDSFTIDGLQVDVFNAYDQIVVDTGSPDVANYASLMFKITGSEDSVLFCGDVYNGFGMQLLEMYGDALDANYVQPGHHGNGSMAPEFYAEVGAEVMFFDGPAWLTESDEYTAKSLIAWCRENGVATYEYATAPNSVPFA